MLKITRLQIIALSICCLFQYGKASSREEDKLKVGNVLIVSHIIAGLGNINWTMNIAKEIKKYSDAEFDFFYHLITEDSVHHLRRRNEVEVEFIDDMGKLNKHEKGSKEKVYLYEKEVDEGYTHRVRFGGITKEI